jgi:hypothetical protein
MDLVWLEEQSKTFQFERTAAKREGQKVKWGEMSKQTRSTRPCIVAAVLILMT